LPKAGVCNQLQDRDVIWKARETKVESTDLGKYFGLDLKIDRRDVDSDQREPEEEK